MSGGQRINDQGSWIGAKGKDSVFPSGPYKTMNESSAEGAGGLKNYEDTTETIRAQQTMQEGDIKKHPMKAGHRH
jgi:hypothetical protein